MLFNFQRSQIANGRTTNAGSLVLFVSEKQISDHLPTSGSIKSQTNSDTVMSWSRDLQNTGCTLSSLPPLWALFRTASSSLQSYHHTYGTSPPDRLETRVAMMLVDQTNEACRSNVGRDLGGVQSMSMVTTQPFAGCERAVECHLTYLVFCIVKEPSSVIWPIRCFA